MGFMLSFMNTGTLKALQSATMLRAHSYSGVTFSLRFPVSAPMMTHSGMGPDPAVRSIGPSRGSAEMNQ